MNLSTHSIGDSSWTFKNSQLDQIDHNDFASKLAPARLVIDAIENTLHWCLDVTFREDESRLRNRFAAENLAWLKRFAIGLIKQNASKESIAMQRRMAGWNDNYLTQLLGLQTL